MRNRYYIALCALVVLLSPLRAGALTQVETFTGTATYQIVLPGNIVGPDIEFDGSLIITSLDFTPGSVTFEGQPVDFDGTEADFLGSSYSGTLTIPAMPNMVVPAIGNGAMAGPGGNMNGNLNKNDLSLGPGFSSTEFDLVVPESFSGVDQTPSWNSPAVPELNGKPVELRTDNDILVVIPNFTTGVATATVDVSFTGAIFALETVPTETTTWSAIKALYQ